MSEARFGSPTRKLTVTIASGQTASGAFDRAHYSIMGIITPGTLTGTALGFSASDELAGTYRTVYKDGTAASVAMAADRAIGIDDLALALAPWRFLKLVSGSAEGAAREFTVILRQ